MLKKGVRAMPFSRLTDMDAALIDFAGSAAYLCRSIEGGLSRFPQKYCYSAFSA